MKIAIDPGHGMSNATAGVFDTGATAKAGGQTFAEADIVLRYALTLKKLCEDAGVDIFMTRSSSAESAPVGGRAGRASKAGCTHFVSLHLNSFKKPQANGVEVQYRDDSKDKPLADALQKSLLKVTGFNDHGNDKRTDLAVLKFKDGPAVLIELGFITNDNDRNFLLDGANRDKICKAIFGVVTGGAAPSAASLAAARRPAASRSPQPGAAAPSGIPTADCTPKAITIKLSNQPAVTLPSSGKFVGESHYVTTDDKFEGKKYPETKKDKIKPHLDRSLAIYRRFDPNATFDQLYGDLPQFQQVWTPSESGHIGQGSVGDVQLTELKPEMETWFMTMMWANGHKPARGTKFLASANGKQVVVIAGYETGPGDKEFLGGVTWEVHKWLGTGNNSKITLALLKDQTAPVGPIKCS